jgi:hypothetical protein
MEHIESNRLIACVALTISSLTCGPGARPTVPTNCPTGNCLAPDEFTDMPWNWAVLDTSTANPANNNNITANLRAAVAALATPQGLTTSSGRPTRTLYIPAGHWTIDRTVNLRNAFAVNIVGADPATTFITWNGEVTSAMGNADGSYPDMFRIFDVSSVKFSRLTLDGGGRARIGVHLFQSTCYDALIAYHESKIYDNISPSFKCDLDQGTADAIKGITAVTRIEVSDDVFQNLEFGLAAGPLAVSIDDVDFAKGLDVGISRSNVGDVVVRRSRFDHISALGINTNGSNVFNWLVADSEFSNCFRGIQVSQHGGVHVINNHFVANGFSTWTNKYARPPTPLPAQWPPARTDGMDIAYNGDIGSVIRDNSSTGSQQFLYLGTFGQLAAHDVSGNYLQIPFRADYPIAAAIVLEATQVSLFDNLIRMTGFPASTPAAPAIPGVLLHGYGTLGYLGNVPRMTHGGNTFITSDPNSNCSATCGTAAPGSSCAYFRSEGNVCGRKHEHCFEPSTAVHELLVDPNSCAVSQGAEPDCPAAGPTTHVAACAAFASAVTPSVPPASHRTVANVAEVAPACSCAAAGSPPQSCGVQLNHWLAQDAAAIGAKPFLFFPPGEYCIDQTLEVPGDRDITIGGDGDATHLFWKGTTVGPGEPYVFRLSAPAKASIRDLSIFIYGSAEAGAVTRAGGVVVDSPDEPGGLVYLDTVSVGAAKRAFAVLGLDRVAVRADMSGAGGVEHVIRVSGGGNAAPTASGDRSSGTQGLLMVAGGSGSFASHIELENWGKIVLLGVDNEAIPQGMELTDSGYLTFATGRFLTATQTSCFYTDQPNAMIGNSFRGRLTLMNLTPLNAVLLAENASPDAQILSLNNFHGVSDKPGVLQPPVSSVCPAVGADLDCSPFTRFSSAAAGATQMALQDSASCLLGSGELDSAPLAYCSDLAAEKTETSSFVKSMLVDVRAARMALRAACASTAVRLHRLSFQGISGPDPSTFMGTAVLIRHD